MLSRDAAREKIQRDPSLAKNASIRPFALMVS